MPRGSGGPLGGPGPRPVGMENRFTQAVEICVKNGWNLVEPAKNELFIDWDRLKKPPTKLSTWQRFSPLVKKVVRVTLSKSGECWHVVLQLDRDLDVPSRVALQAIMGSDPMREAHALQAHLDGDPGPILFFELEEKKGTANG